MNKFVKTSFKKFPFYALNYQFFLILTILADSKKRFISFIVQNQSQSHLNTVVNIFKMVNIDIREISPKLQKKAEAELNEVPSRIAEDILALKTWIGKQAHLRARTDDQFLLAFLRGCKYSLERVKEKLDLHFTIRGLMTDVFIGRDPTDPISLEIIRTG